MRFNPLKKLILASACWTLAAGLLAFGVISFHARIKNFGEVLGAAHAKVEDFEEKREDTKRLSLFFKEHKADVERMQRFFIDSQHPIDFIEELERIARQTGNSISLAVDEGTRKEGALLFHVSAEGKEGGLRRMLEAFEFIPYASGIESVTFQAGAGGKEAALYPSNPQSNARMEITLRVKTR